MRDNPGAGMTRLLSAIRCKWHCLVVLTVLCAGLASSVVLFFTLRDQELDHIRQQFTQAAQDRISALERTLAHNFLTIRALRAFYVSSDKLERNEFNAFSALLLKDQPSIQALQWVPCVRNAEAAAFESQAARDGHHGFRITEYDQKGFLVRAQKREKYFPVFYIEPKKGSVASLGFDLATIPSCWQAMQQACDTGQFAAAAKIPLSRDSNDEFGVRVYLPVYRDNAKIHAVADRRRHLEGFVAGILRLEALVEQSLSALTPAGIDIQVSDSSAPSQEDLLYVHRSRLKGTRERNENIAGQRLDYSLFKILDIAGRRWTIRCAATPQFAVLRTKWYPWGAAAAGFLLTGLLTTYLVGSSIQISKRTRFAAQMAETNRQLEKEIADRKQAELTLWESEIRYKTLYDSSNDAIMLAKPDEGFLDGNRAALTMFGCKDQREFISCAPADLSPEYQPDGALSTTKSQQMMAIAMQAGSHCFEWKHKRKDGSEFDAVVSVSRMEFGDSRLLLATVRDITAQKRAEERQTRSLQRLEGLNRLQEDLFLLATIEDKFRKIADTAVTLLELDFCRIWMVKPGDLCQNGCIHAAAADPEHMCLHRERCLHLMTSSGRYTHIDGNHRRVPIGAYKIGRIASGADYKFLTNDVTTDPQVHNHQWAKSLGLASFAGYKLRNANGNTVGVLAMFSQHPISEEDDAFLSNLAETTSRVILDYQAAEELRKTKEQAVEANRAKSRFLANMSHEIRTPLTAILGYSDLLMDAKMTASSRNNYSATIRRNGEHLLSIINDILDLSKIEAGKMSADIKPCNIVALLADVASIVRPRAKQHGIDFVVEYPGELPERIHTDGAHLRQAILNLAGNAVKFTEHGGVRIATSFLPQWRDDQPAVKFEVIDTGVGILPEMIPYLFQPFSQGDVFVAARFGGTGLGLAIARQIARLLGGDLSVTSEWGHGSNFSLTIPTGNLAGVSMLHRPAEVMLECAGKPWTPPVDDLKGVRILLAEDGYDNRELIQTVLHQAGAEVETAINGCLAVDKAETESFDLILMDMNMPEMDGYQATRLLRDHGYEKPILALTANAMSGDREQCRAAGCNEYLSKPIDRVQLIRMIADFTGKNVSVGQTAPSSIPDMLSSMDDSGTSGFEGSCTVETYADEMADAAIISQYIDDPDMAEILDGFIKRLPGQLDEMRHTLADGQYDELRRLAHKLKGAGGSYGYPSLTEACKTLEEAAKSRNPAEIEAPLEGVATLIKSVQNGYQAGNLTGTIT